MSSIPLQAVHQAGGAQFDEAALLPRTYGNIRAEYEALRSGVAVIDFSPEGKLTISGKNAVQFINGLVTNDVKNLQPGHGVSAAFLDAQGRTQAICRIYNTGAHLLLTTHPERRAKVFQNLHRFTLAGEFFLQDVTEEQALISLQGPRAAELLTALTGQAVAFEAGKLIACDIAAQPATVVSHARCGATGFDLFVAAAAAPELWQMLLSAGAGFGACAVGQEAFDIARIEAGIPREVTDVSENNILVEAGFAEAVSYSKGCYLGQEIIARIHFRGQPAKRLLKLAVTAATLPPAGAGLYAADGKKVGSLTSLARHPLTAEILALGYVHRYYLAKGTELTISSGDVAIGTAIVSDGVTETESSQPSGPVVSHNISQIIT